MSSLSVTPREIVTIQFGHYANFVGSHWWNIQNSSFVYHPHHLVGAKEINNDVLFREGINLMGEITYTPRLIACDLKGSLNSLKEDGTLYDIHDDVDDHLSWMGDVTIHKVNNVPKNEFLQDLDHEEQTGRAVRVENSNDETEKEVMCFEEEVFGPKLFYDLDDKINVWSDFLKPHLHPKTLEIVKSYLHDSENESFGVFGYGLEVYKEQREEIEDRLHFFAEECDHLEGFNFIVDAYNAFGGLASSFLNDILDDYNKKCVMIYSVSPAAYRRSGGVIEEQRRLLSLALSYQSLVPGSSMFVPLSTSTSLYKQTQDCCQFPHLQYKSSLPYHSSAILAACIDTMTLPYRLETNTTSATDISNLAASSGRKLISGHISFPFPLNENNSSSHLQTLSNLSKEKKIFFQSLTPFVPTDDSPHAQYVVCRGIQPDRINSGSSVCPAPSCDEMTKVDSLLRLHLEKVFSHSLNSLSTLRQRCKVISPFPNIFSRYVTTDGFISSSTKRSTFQGVQSVPVMTSLQSSSGGKLHLKMISDQVSQLKIQKLHSFLDAGLELDEFNEMLESLNSQILCYETVQRDMM